MSGEFPKFYEMESDIIVKVDLDPNDPEKVVGVTSAGKPFPPAKALYDGWETTEAAFNAQSNQSLSESESASAAEE